MNLADEFICQKDPVLAFRVSKAKVINRIKFRERNFPETNRKISIKKRLNNRP